MKLKKHKTSIILILIILVIASIIYYFYFSGFTTSPGSILSPISYRNDCGKPLENFDVLFVYLTTCPHCKNDLKRMTQLNLLDKAYMIDATNPNCKNIINEYSDYILYHKNSNFQNLPAGIYTPTKVCIYNNETFIGEQSDQELMSFFENCEKARS
jgi:hypothetical protein